MMYSCVSFLTLWGVTDARDNHGNGQAEPTEYHDLRWYYQSKGSEFSDLIIYSYILMGVPACLCEVGTFIV